MQAANEPDKETQALFHTAQHQYSSHLELYATLQRKTSCDTRHNLRVGSAKRTKQKNSCDTSGPMLSRVTTSHSLPRDCQGNAAHSIPTTPLTPPTQHSSIKAKLIIENLLLTLSKLKLLEQHITKSNTTGPIQDPKIDIKAGRSTFAPLPPLVTRTAVLEAKHVQCGEVIMDMVLVKIKGSGFRAFQRRGGQSNKIFLSNTHASTICCIRQLMSSGLTIVCVAEMHPFLGKLHILSLLILFDSSPPASVLWCCHY